MAWLCRWLVPLDARATGSVYFPSPPVPWRSEAVADFPVRPNSHLFPPVLLHLAAFQSLSISFGPALTWQMKHSLRFLPGIGKLVRFPVSFFLSYRCASLLVSTVQPFSSPPLGLAQVLRYSTTAASALCQFTVPALTCLVSWPTLFHSHSCLFILREQEVKWRFPCKYVFDSLTFSL